MKDFILLDAIHGGLFIEIVYHKEIALFVSVAKRLRNDKINFKVD